MSPKFSEGEDVEKLESELKALLGNGWELDAEQIQLQKTYYFKTYTNVLVRDTIRHPSPA
jgi:4a-hydroxytetrahydrobiopterin dehydratase